MGQQEIHLRLSRVLRSLGITVVLVYTDLPSSIEHRLRDGGAAVERVSYANGPSHYYRELGRIIRQYSCRWCIFVISTISAPSPWLTKLQGVKHIVYEELNSGMLHARPGRNSSFAFGRPS